MRTVLDAFAGTGALRSRSLVARRRRSGVYRDATARRWRSCAAISTRSAKPTAPASCAGDATRPPRGDDRLRRRLSRPALCERSRRDRRWRRSPRRAGSRPDALAVVEIGGARGIGAARRVHPCSTSASMAPRASSFCAASAPPEIRHDQRPATGGAARRRVGTGARPGHLAYGRGPPPGGARRRRRCGSASSSA